MGLLRGGRSVEDQPLFGSNTAGPSPLHSTPAGRRHDQGTRSRHRVGVHLAFRRSPLIPPGTVDSVWTRSRSTTSPSDDQHAPLGRLRQSPSPVQRLGRSDTARPGGPGQGQRWPRQSPARARQIRWSLMRPPVMPGGGPGPGPSATPPSRASGEQGRRVAARRGFEGTTLRALAGGRGDALQRPRPDRRRPRGLRAAVASVAGARVHSRPASHGIEAPREDEALVVAGGPGPGARSRCAFAPGGGKRPRESSLALAAPLAGRPRVPTHARRDRPRRRRRRAWWLPRDPSGRGCRVISSIQAARRRRGQVRTPNRDRHRRPGRIGDRCSAA